MVVAQALREAAGEEVKLHPGDQLKRISVRIGSWSGVDPDAVRSAFAGLFSAEHQLAPQLDVELCPPENLCLRCGCRFAAAGPVASCPSCGTFATRRQDADPFEVTRVEFEGAARPH